MITDEIEHALRYNLPAAVLKSVRLATAKKEDATRLWAAILTYEVTHDTPNTLPPPTDRHDCTRVNVKARKE